MIQNFSDFQRDARLLSEDEFLGQNPHPVLVVEPFATREDSAYVTRTASPASEEKGHERGVAVLAKRSEKDAFRMMITIGRAKSSDVYIPCEDVSKFHAYVLTKPNQGPLSFADAGSTFGTLLNGVRLEAREATPLAAGTEIQFGSVRTTFYTPEAFRELLLQPVS